MFQIIPSLEKELTFPEYFGVAGDNWGKFSFDSPLFSYILYIFFGIVVLLLLKIVIDKIRADLKNKDLKNKERYDSEKHKETVDPETAIKSGQKRDDVRFKALPDFPIRVYLVSKKIDAPVACNCIDFSAGGILVEFEEPEIGCLEYLLKKNTFVREKGFSIAMAQGLTIYEILSQPFEAKQFLRFKKQMRDMEELKVSILKTRNFISSLGMNDILEIFFILPALPFPEEVNNKLLPLENRTIQCSAVIKNENHEKNFIALHFQKIGYKIKDTIYQYGLETWRLKQQGSKFQES